MGELEAVETEVTEEEGTDVLTAHDVREIVNDAFASSNDAQQVAIEGLAANVQSLTESVTSLQASEQQEHSETLLVRLEPSQVETFKAGARVACTEGLILVLLLAVLVGLQCFRIFTGRWS